MAPEPRPIPRFVAEPPHEGRPYGRWAESLARHFLEACEQIDADEDLGGPGDVVWFPDRTFAGRTYIPASATTSTGYELLGMYVRPANVRYRAARSPSTCSRWSTTACWPP